MSRSFRESYIGKPLQAVRGFYFGKKREAAKRGRYRFKDMYDEEGTPDLPAAGKRWIQNGWQCWSSIAKGHKTHEVVFRNGRKFMRRRRNIEVDTW